MPARKKVKLPHKGPNSQNSRSIGGLPIGTTGSTGIYTGYTHVFGDDFNELINLYNTQNPTGKYGSIHIYGSGSRTVAGALANEQDCDAFYTGTQNLNRGVPIFTNTLLQGNGAVSVRIRTADSYESTFTNGRQLVGGMIHTGGYVAVNPPCIVEWRVYYQQFSSQPNGWHPTAWLENGCPLDGSFSLPSPGQVEFDFPELGAANFNTHGTTIGPASAGTGIPGNIYGQYQLYSLVLDSTGAYYYHNGSLVQTIAQDCTNTLKPYYILFTGHTTNPDLTAYAALGQSGTYQAMDYYRIHLPNAVASTNVIKPLQSGFQLPVQQVAFNTSFTYTFPSTATLFGSASGLSDYCQSMRMEDMEPGAATEGCASYLQFPTELTWNNGTRVLSGTVSDRPGRLNMICTPFITGGVGSVGFVARGYLDVGPQILTTTLNASQNVPFAYDLYPDGDCGTLFIGKTMTCTGLPTGLSFSPTTFLITGTPTTIATTSITIGVTNASGQSVTKNVNIVVSATTYTANITGAAVVTGVPLSTTYTANITGTSVVTGVPVSTNNLAQDGFATSITVTGLACTVTLTTTMTNDIIVVMPVFTSGSTQTVSTVTDTAGLTWTKLTSQAGSSQIAEEIWWAYSSGALSSDNIVVTGVGFAPGRVTAFGVNGVSAPNYSAPWDTNAGVPKGTFHSSTNTTNVTISTTATNTMLLSLLRVNGSAAGITRPSGWNSLGSSGANQDNAYNVVSSSQTSVTETFSWTTSNENILIVAAIRQ